MVVSAIYPKLSWRTREGGFINDINNTSNFFLVKLGIKSENDIVLGRAAIGVSTSRGNDGEGAMKVDPSGKDIENQNKADKK